MGGCSDTTAFLGMDLEAGAVLVYAAIDDSGASQGGVVIARDQRLLLPDVPADGRLYTWALPPGAYVDVYGTPLDEETIAQFSVSFDEAAGACVGRCLIPTARAPQILRPGEACRPPSFAKAEAWALDGVAVEPLDLTPDKLEDVRQQTRIVREGTCACTPEGHEPVQYRAMAPFGAERQIAEVSQFEDDRLVGFGPFDIWTYDPSTGATSTQRHDRQYAVNTNLIHVRTTAGNEVLVSASQPQRRDPVGFMLDVYERRGDTFEFVRDASEDFPNPIEPTDVQRHTNNGDETLFLMGEVGAQTLSATYEAGLALCREGPIRCRVANLTVGECGARPREHVRDVEVFDNGAAIALADRHMFFRAPGEDDWVCHPLPTELRAEDLVIDRFLNSGHIGSRYFACAITEGRFDGTLRPLVFTTTVADEAPNETLSLVHIGPVGEWCGEFLRGATPDELRLVNGWNTLVELDAAGGTSTVTVGASYGPIPWFGRLRDLDDGWHIAETAHNGLHLSRAGSGRFERVRGDEVTQKYDYAAIVATPEDEFFLFSRHAPFQKLAIVDGPSGPTASLEVFEDHGTLDPSQLSIVAAIVDQEATDESGASTFVIGGSDARGAVLHRLVIDGTRITSVEPIGLPASSTSRRIVLLAELAPGLIVAFGDADEMFAIRDGTLVQQDVDFDDPTTEVVERAPPATWSFRLIANAGGAAWVAGPDGYLFRVTAVGAERFAFTALALTAISAECPDIAWVAGDREYADSERVTQVLTASQLRDVGSIRSHEMIPIADDLASQYRSRKDTNGVPRAIINDKSGIDLLLDLGLNVRIEGASADVVRLPTARGNVWARDRRGRVVFAGNEGGIVLGTP